MAYDLLLTVQFCQVSIEYQTQAGVAQRQARGKGISIELQCGGNGSLAHISIGLTPREVGAQAQQKLRQVLSTQRQEQLLTIAIPLCLALNESLEMIIYMLQEKFSVKPPLSVVSSRIQEGLLTICLQRVHIHTGALPYSVQVRFEPMRTSP